mmetsp:Transcript_5237/g.19603  ORF Transcript_5237/g.19603 Transcript_5237/m.19603 type:complete len:289 (+) Transcript_5237:1973-2839(+)
MALARVEVVIEEPGNAVGIEQEAVGEELVRGGGGPAGGARRDQQLQGQRQAAVAGEEGRAGGQRAAGAVTRHAEPGAVQAERGSMLVQPGQSGPGIVHRGREAMLGCEPVVQRHHGRATAQAELAAQAVVGFQVADREAAAVQIEQHRQHGVARRVQPRGPAGDFEVRHAGQRCARQVEDLGAHPVGDARFARRQAVKGRAVGAVDAFEQPGHARRQHLGGWFHRARSVDGGTQGSRSGACTGFSFVGATLPGCCSLPARSTATTGRACRARRSGPRSALARRASVAA